MQVLLLYTLSLLLNLTFGCRYATPCVCSTCTPLEGTGFKHSAVMLLQCVYTNSNITLLYNMYEVAYTFYIIMCYA